jgi:hypothetical protein
MISPAVDKASFLISLNKESKSEEQTNAE